MNAVTPTLTPLALQNADVLRELLATAHPTIAALARAVGRDADNLRKTVKALAAAGLTEPDFDGGPVPHLSDAGFYAVRAIERAERPGETSAPSANPAAGVLVRHQLIVPDPLNPRKHFDPEELVELANSIARDDLLENLVVRPAQQLDIEGETHRLVAGERRWRAIGLLIADGRWPADKPVPCQIRDIDDAAHRRIALVENLQRKDLRPIDEALGLKALIEMDGLSTAEVAAEIGFTQRFVQQRLQLLELPPIKKVELEKGIISIEKARQWLANRPKPLDLSDKHWLQVMEIYDKVLKDPVEGNPMSTECHADARFWEDMKFLNDWPNQVMGIVSHIIDGNGDPTGRFKISNSYWSEEKLKLKFGEIATPTQRHHIMMDLRGKAFWPAAGPGLYSTPWLNGPFDIAPSLQKEINEARTAAAARRAEQEAFQNQQNEAAADAKRKAGEVFNQAQSIRVQYGKGGVRPIDPRFEDALAEAGVLLPVHVGDDGAVRDAGGKELVRTGYHASNVPPLVRARNTLLAVALNAAGGRQTPDGQPIEPDHVDEVTFLRMVAEYLQEDAEDLPEGDAGEAEALERAQRGLKAFLLVEGVAYGDAAYDWEEDGAMALAAGIREEGLGQQIALEEAIAQADDGEIPASVQALATGHAAPIGGDAEDDA